MNRIFDRVVGSMQTTNATVTTAATYAVPDDSVIAVDVTVICKTMGNVKRFSTKSIFFRTGGGVATEAGDPLEVLSSQGSVSLVTATILLEANGNNIRVRVTGVLLTTIDWDYSIETHIFTP